MQKSAFAFPSPALPTEGGRESEIGENALRFCAGSVFQPAGSTPCGVGMSQFTRIWDALYGLVVALVYLVYPRVMRAGKSGFAKQKGRYLS